MAENESERRIQDQPDELAYALNDLFIDMSTMIKSELQGTNNLLERLEKMNHKVAEEYNNYRDAPAGLRVFMEQLKHKNGNFEEYLQIIEQQVTEFKAAISMLDKYVLMLERKMQSAYQIPRS